MNTANVSRFKTEQNQFQYRAWGVVRSRYGWFPFDDIFWAKDRHSAITQGRHIFHNCKIHEITFPADKTKTKFTRK